MQHFLIYDGHCSVCQGVAADIASMAQGKLETISIYSGAAQALLDQAYPEGWAHAPYMVMVDEGKVQTWTGVRAGLHLGGLIGFREAFALMRRHHLFITPKGVHRLSMPTVSRRAIVKAGAVLGLASLLPKLPDGLDLPGSSLLEAEVAEAQGVCWPLDFKPFGPFSCRHRLGSANQTRRNAKAFSTQVYRFPADAPIYQQQLVHNNKDDGGPQSDRAQFASSTSRCSEPDNDRLNNYIFREVNGHHHTFGRLNFSESVGENYLSYMGSSYNKLFYVMNEPELGTSTMVPDGNPLQSCYCFAPPTWKADIYFKNRYGTNEGTTGPHYEGSGLMKVGCYNASSTDGRRVRAVMAANVFYHALQETRTPTNIGRGHVVVPASAAATELGNSSVANYRDYWTAYYDRLLKPTSQGGLGLPVSDLSAIHVHKYSDFAANDDTDSDPLPYGPLNTAASTAVALRKGADWFRGRYLQNGQIPLHYLISELGPPWELDQAHLDPQLDDWVWTGGFKNMTDGLVYWNSLLRWLYRSAPADLGLASGYVAYAMKHGSSWPFVLTKPATPGRAYQTYMEIVDSVGTWVSRYNVLNVKMLTAASDSNYTRFYNNRFSIETNTPNPLAWTNDTGAVEDYAWAPFLACYNVWNEVGADPTGGTFGTGWYGDGGNQGTLGSVTVSVKAGWNTVYIPFIKGEGAWDGTCRFSFHWNQPNGALQSYGHSDPYMYANSTTVTVGTYSQPMRASWVEPVLIKSAVDKTLTLEVRRTWTGTPMFIGRPVVAHGIGCSWRSE